MKRKVKKKRKNTLKANFPQTNEIKETGHFVNKKTIRKNILLDDCFLQLEQGTLVIAELHLGKPQMRDYKLSGKNIRESFDRINSLLRKENPEELIILGDVKEKIGLPPKPLQEKMKKGFRTLLDHVKRIKVIKGNHDGRIEDFLDFERVTFKKKEERVIHGRKVLLFHGHKFFPLTPYDLAISAHIHPAANISSENLSVPLVKVWASFQLSFSKGEIHWIILPAFSRWIKGIALNTLQEKRIRELMPFTDKGDLTLEELNLLYTDLTPLKKIRFSSEQP